MLSVLLVLLASSLLRGMASMAGLLRRLLLRKERDLHTEQRRFLMDQLLPALPPLPPPLLLLWLVRQQ